ncbi:hypothetical protein [Phytohabitans kaempferiae]|uniref:Uncharacterized protein n=1 Tax=Phytohabitans kaempferiae TaxID=1620943 RepID=A0ABV6MFP4_9ACTN
MEPGGDEPPGSAAMIPGVRALVETVLLSARGGRLSFRTVTRPLGTGEHPDACARSLAGVGVGLLHSTSWRHTSDGLVLTYVALSDPDPAAPAAPVLDLPAARGRGPLTPSPAVVRPVDVAAHACRHLAFLRHTDPQVAAAAAEQAELWDHIDVFTPAVAGLLPIGSR